MTAEFEELYKSVLGDELDKTDPIVKCMADLKDQLKFGQHELKVDRKSVV